MTSEANGSMRTLAYLVIPGAIRDDVIDAQLVTLFCVILEAQRRIHELPYHFPASFDMLGI